MHIHVTTYIYIVVVFTSRALLILNDVENNRAAPRPPRLPVTRFNTNSHNHVYKHRIPHRGFVPGCEHGWVHGCGGMG